MRSTGQGSSTVRLHLQCQDQPSQNSSIFYVHSNGYDIPPKTHFSTLNIKCTTEIPLRYSSALVSHSLFFYCKPHQELFWNKVFGNVILEIDIHSARAFSILGRAMITNTIIPSRLWHLAWIVSSSIESLDKVRQAVVNFVCLQPVASWDMIAIPDTRKSSVSSTRSLNNKSFCSNICVT
jgi:hypothetical protein